MSTIKIRAEKVGGGISYTVTMGREAIASVKAPKLQAVIDRYSTAAVEAVYYAVAGESFATFNEARSSAEGSYTERIEQVAERRTAGSIERVVTGSYYISMVKGWYHDELVERRVRKIRRDAGGWGDLSSWERTLLLRKTREEESFAINLCVDLRRIELEERGEIAIPPVPYLSVRAEATNIYAMPVECPAEKKEAAETSEVWIGDKVRLRTRGARGVVVAIGASGIRVETDNGTTILCERDITNYSLAARRAWQTQQRRSGRLAA